MKHVTSTDLTGAATKRKKDVYNVAVIGAGAIGLDHIASFQSHPAARVVGLADTSPHRGQEAADKFKIPEFVHDYRKLLKRPEIDVVSIALPNYLHAPVGLDALRAGKHVMIDKPIATNAADAIELTAEAAKRKLLLMVGQNQRFTPEVQTAKQLIDDGALGDLYHAKTAWLRRAGIPRVGSWFTQKKLAGGGCAYDIGAHALDRCLFLMGEFDAAAVSAQTYAQFGPRNLGNGQWGRSEIDAKLPFDVDDLAVALIRLKSGRTVLLETSWAGYWPADYNGTQILGTEAGLTFPPLQLIRKTERSFVTETLDTSTALVSSNRMVHFIDCLLGKAEPYVKPAESVAVQKILDAVYKSARTGREIRIRGNEPR